MPANPPSGSAGEDASRAPLDVVSGASTRRTSPQPPSAPQSAVHVSLHQAPPAQSAAMPPTRLQRSHSMQGARIAFAAPQPPPFATSAAAAATSAKTRPKLNVSTTYATPLGQAPLQSPTSAAPQRAQDRRDRRRLWFRKRTGGPATSLLVDASELVDDVKSRILMKYPTSLLQNCDPADLVVTVAPGSAARVELRPDENVWAVLDRHFADGMTISDALELSAPATTQFAPPAQGAIPVRTALQRARSYSNTHYQNYSSLSPSAAPPLPQRHPSEPNTPISTSPHAASPGPPHSPTTESRADARHHTSVLLMPRQLGGPSGPLSLTSERELDGHSTTLVPLTGNESGTSSTAWSSASNAPHKSQAKDQAAADAGGSLPLSSLPSSVGLASLQLGKSSVVPQINILIVEDNKINQLILERFLQRKNVRSAVATNGREALEKWRAGGFHLILMDIQLPEMSGLEVTKEIRRLETVNGVGAFPQAFRGHKRPLSPADNDVLPKSKGGFRSPVIIVALTASSEMIDKSEALAAGCNDFLTKPVNLTWLEQKITEWGCMQALIDYAGWKQWSLDSPYRSLSRVELQAAQADHADSSQQVPQRQGSGRHSSQTDTTESSSQDPILRQQHSQGPIATSS